MDADGIERPALHVPVGTATFMLTDVENSTRLQECSLASETLSRALNHCSYTEVACISGIPLGGIGPTRARALRQLWDKLDQHQAGPGAGRSDPFGCRRRWG